MSFEIDTASDYQDLLERLDSWLTAAGSAFGLQYTGTGDGRLTAYRGKAPTVAETFTIQATSSTNFTVTGSVSGPLSDATVGTPYVSTYIDFTLVAGGTPFVSGDTFTISTAPAWLLARSHGGGIITATEGNSGQLAAQNLADGKLAADDARIWRVDAPTIPQDIEIQLRASVTVHGYSLARFSTAGVFEYGPKDWDFQYWDGGGWVTLDSQSDVTAWGPDEVKTFTFATVSASLFRLHITATNGNGRLYLGAIGIHRTTGPGPQAHGDHVFADRIWELPGNDGAWDGFFCGVHPYERQDADYFNWELAAFDNHNGDNVGTPFYLQAGAEYGLHIPLWNSSIPYWFINDGRRVVVVAKINTQYEVAIMAAGLDPYFSPGQWPRPFVLGGTLAFGTPAKQQGEYPTWESTRFRFSNASNNHRSPIHADPDNPFYGEETRLYQLRARNLDGSWSGYEGTKQDGISASPAGKPIIWPTRCGVSLWDPNVDGGSQLLPVMLCHNAPNFPGRLSGIRAVSGQGLSAESLIFDGNIDWLVLPNITRTDRDDWLAVALD